MEEGLPEEDTEQSREGILLHDYAAHPEYKREVLKPHQRDLLEISDSLVQNVVNRITKEHWVGQFRECLIEGIISGRPDLIFRYENPDWSLIVDQKFGFKIVERADLNLQLRSYAVIVYDFLDQKPQKTFVSIVQPRLRYEERVTIAEYLPEDIEASRLEIKQILKRSTDPKAPLVAGEEQCRYCKSKLICPAFKKMFGDMHKIIPMHQSVLGSQDWTVRKKQEFYENQLATITDAQLSSVRLAVNFAEMIKSQVNDETRKRILAGGMTDYELAKDSTVRKITDPQKAIALLVIAGVLSREQLLEICQIPLGKVEEKYREHTKATWDAARDRINLVLRSVIETEQRKGRILSK